MRLLLSIQDRLAVVALRRGEVADPLVRTLRLVVVTEGVKQLLQVGQVLRGALVGQPLRYLPSAIASPLRRERDGPWEDQAGAVRAPFNQDHRCVWLLLCRRLRRIGSHRVPREEYGRFSDVSSIASGTATTCVCGLRPTA